jgi:hypothetical protein
MSPSIEPSLSRSGSQFGFTPMGQNFCAAEALGDVAVFAVGAAFFELVASSVCFVKSKASAIQELHSFAL